MHTPRIFITPAMSGYAYKGISSAEYKDSLCRAITSGFMPYDECLKVIRECVIELRNTFGALQDVDAVFAAADKINSIESCITAAEGASSVEPAVQAGVLYRLIHRLYDALQDCTTAPCNKEVPCFMDVSFIRRSAHLQIAKACGILVNSVVIVNCLIKTITMRSASVMGGSDADSVFHAGLTLSAYVNVQFSALSRCLNYSPGPEETKRRKAILRVVRHNIELCNKVAELVDPEIPYCFRDRTASCLNSMLDAVGSTSAECEEMVSNDDSAKSRLALAKKARTGFLHHFKTYKSLGLSIAFESFRRDKYVEALVYAIGSLFSMHRGYASTGNAGRIVVGKINHCLQMLLTLYKCKVRRVGASEYMARELYADMCSVHEDVEKRITPDLLLNPQVEIKLRDAALHNLSVMMNTWKEMNAGYFGTTEQPDGSPSQPSTSGLGSAAGAGEPQATSSLRAIEGTSSSPSQPSTSGLGSTAEGLGDQLAFYIPSQDHSYVQPSTSAEASSALQEAQVASHRSQTPSDDELEPPSKRSRSA
ncbi:putative hGE-14 protein [Anaplasma phagocytophilum str. ApNP]|uniref:Putative hGE-14 protein n=2 Tax=Anaplasma phagocytophilum TaxID=948 RepID=A0A0F3NJ36_ANAPH|nr:putative hGE-14 protein [Anaplasma phagocytophilum str. ApNP]